MNTIKCILIILTLNNCLVSTNFAGKYYVIFRGLEKCPNPEQYTYQIDTKVRKFNRTHHAYSVLMNTSYSIDDTMSIDINVAKKGNGGFKDNFYFVQYDNICTAGNKLAPHAMARLARFLNRDSICPLPPGIYNGTNYLIPVQYTNEDFPVAPYGYFRAQVIIVKNLEDGRQEKLLCFRMYGESVPAG